MPTPLLFSSKLAINSRTMRIRKNANISAVLYTNSNLSSHNNETNFCQLNQSPWDIITFPPSHSSSPSLNQFDGFDTRYNVDFAGNWSWVDSVGAVESVASMKNSFECEYDNVYANGNVDDTVKDYESYEKEDDLGFMEEDEEIVLCCKANGKGLQCERVAKNGNTMCDHHVVDFKNDEVWSTKKKTQPVSGPTTRPTGSRPPRVKKRVVAVPTNPYEFYYYSGFGPTWGKKRGTTEMKNTSFNACSTTTISNSNVYEISGVDWDAGVEKVKRVEPGKTMIKESWSCEVGPCEEDLDYVDEEEYDEKKKVGKKRGRKPIKARSLKSLM